MEKFRDNSEDWMELMQSREWDFLNRIYLHGYISARFDPLYTYRVENTNDYPNVKEIYLMGQADGEADRLIWRKNV